ncbi:MAG: hypothetical protein AAFX99_27070, partial [Myxococcota bacterium]
MKPNLTRAIFAVAGVLTLAAVAVAARTPAPQSDCSAHTTTPRSKATPVVQTGNTVAMTARLSHGKLLRSTESQTGALLLDLKALAKPPQELAPVDLAIVIDRSGSMAEEGKMQSARRAALALIDELRPSDRVASSWGG